MEWGGADELISIHAPRTGSDRGTVYSVSPSCDFNPRSPHGERPALYRLLRDNKIFQSTLPARGATRPRPDYRLWREADFNPRSPHGERPCKESATAESIRISIHAPRTGSDASVRRKNSAQQNFNPRSPHGERLRAFPSVLHPDNFNPRSPHGERPLPRYKHRMLIL